MFRQPENKAVAHYFLGKTDFWLQTCSSRGIGKTSKETYNKKKGFRVYPNMKPRIKPITKPMPNGSIPNSRIAS